MPRGRFTRLEYHAILRRRGNVKNLKTRMFSSYKTRSVRVIERSEREVDLQDGQVNLRERIMKRRLRRDSAYFFSIFPSNDVYGILIGLAEHRYECAATLTFKTEYVSPILNGDRSYDGRHHFCSVISIGTLLLDAEMTRC